MTKYHRGLYGEGWPTVPACVGMINGARLVDLIAGRPYNQAEGAYAAAFTVTDAEGWPGSEWLKPWRPQEQ